MSDINGDVDLAQNLIEGEIEAFKELELDVVIHGFYPIASLARRIILPAQNSEEKTYKNYSREA